MQVETLDEGLVRYTAPNGVRVLVEVLPAVRSAVVGVWVRTASAHESPGAMGVSHLLEHMVFKGTRRRSARDLALALEVRGGSLDAWTSRDHTSFQAHVLDEDLPLAVDILSDLVMHPLLRESDLALERNVVLEEIHGVLDTPDDLVFDLHARALWPTHPYGFSILGTPETVRGLTAEDLASHHQTGYHLGNCVIAAAGHLEPEVLLAALDREGWFAPDPARQPPRAPIVGAPAVRGAVHEESRDTTQVHMVIGSDTITARDPRRYALAVAVNLLGGGMSSRLFQRVREELGLAYAVYAWQHLYQATGVFGVYVGTRPETADAARDAILAELARVASEGIPAGELADGKRQLKGQLMLSLESPASRMHRMASTELHQDIWRPLSRVLADIDAVTEADVAGVAAEFLAPARQTVVRLGP